MKSIPEATIVNNNHRSSDNIMYDNFKHLKSGTGNLNGRGLGCGKSIKEEYEWRNIVRRIKKCSIVVPTEVEMDKAHG
jgi:hypothetical protein